MAIGFFKKRKGLFITFEGPECAGKTTQIQMLKEYFNRTNRGCIITREPGGTEIGEELRKIVKHHKGHSPVTDEAEILLFAASRAQHVKEIIQPVLDSNMVVICDRFADSTTAYQGYARGIELNFIADLNKFATCGCQPDLTILLDLSAEESMERSSKREETLFIEDRIESETIQFHRKVRDGFLKIAEENPDRVKVIPAVQSREIIHNQILEQVNNVS